MNSEISISPHTTKHSIYRAIRFSKSNCLQNIFNNPNLLTLTMSQRAVLKLSKNDSFTVTPSAVEKPTKIKLAYKQFTPSASKWTNFLDTSYLPAKRIHISGLPIDNGEVEVLLEQLSTTFHFPISDRRPNAIH